MSTDNQLMELNDYTIPATAKAVGRNYIVTINGGSVKLERDVDFGKVGQMQKPSLYKAGAEKIVGLFHLSQEYVIESAIENFTGEAPFCFYRVLCKLYCYINGERYDITQAHGSANSMERGVGRQSAFECANQRLKIAEKRALTSAAVRAAGLSGLFTMDIEDDAIEAAKIDVVKEDSPVTAAQIKRLFAIASSAGVSADKASEVIKSFGYESSKAITQKDYDAVCEAVKNGGRK